jgi:hypothetical protein
MRQAGHVARMRAKRNAYTDIWWENKKERDHYQFQNVLKKTLNSMV